MNFIVLCILIPPMVEDIKTREIRNIYFLLIIFIKCIRLFIEKDVDLVIDSACGFFVAAIIMLVCFLFNRTGIGGGDIKLLISLGFAFGIKLFLSGLFYVSLCSVLFSLILLATKKASKNTQLPFVPFIFTGMLVATLVEVIL